MSEAATTVTEVEPRAGEASSTPSGWRERIAVRRRFAMHKLRWTLSSRRRIERYVDRVLDQEAYGWIFLLGVNNSGTTLIANVLESHPLVRCMDWEGQDYTNELPHPWDYGAARLWTVELDRFRWTEADVRADAVRIKYDWTLRYPAPPGYLFEKSPPNVLRSRWLQHNFRPARFIATFRSPYAVCEGVRRRMDCTIEQAASHWATANRILLEDISRLERVLSYRYEELCQDPQAVLGKVDDFLEVRRSVPSEVLDRVEAHSMDGRTRGITNMNARSIERLSAEDIRTINGIAGPVMEELGYDRL